MALQRPGMLLSPELPAEGPEPQPWHVPRVCLVLLALALEGEVSRALLVPSPRASGKEMFVTCGKRRWLCAAGGLAGPWSHGLTLGPASGTLAGER